MEMAKNLGVVVFNATFNTISVLLEKTTDKLYNVASGTPLHEWDSNSQLQ